MFDAVLRIDGAAEVDYERHGGILQMVLRQMLAGSEQPRTTVTSR